MTFPTWGSCGAAGTGALFGPFTFGAASVGEGVTEGLTDEGRDQPGPVVVEGWAVAVSLVVTSRE